MLPHHRFMLLFPLLSFISLALAAPLLALGDDGNPLSEEPSYVGTFSEPRLSVTLTDAGVRKLAGTIKQGDEQFPLKATAGDTGLSGTFDTGGKSYKFTAAFNGDILVLSTGKSTYNLKRVASAPVAETNPLDAPPAASGVKQAGAPGAASQPAADDKDVATFGTFTVLGTTDHGKTLFLKLASAATVEAAITQTADAVGKVCDGKPKIDGAFADQGKVRGGATFTAAMKGAAMRGWIFASAAKAPAAGTASATVVLASADDAPADVQTLFAYLPAASQMKTHTFPDNSGSVDLPPGWATKNTSITHGAVFEGPAGQAIISGVVISINTPECTLLRTRQQNHQMMVHNYQMQTQMYQQLMARNRQLGMRAQMQPPQAPPPFDPDPTKEMPNLLFCRFCDGIDEVNQYLNPYLIAHCKTLGQPFTTIDKIIEQAPAVANPQIPGAKAAVQYAATTEHDGEKETHYRAVERIETWPINDGKEMWSISVNSMRAPDATFEKDFPIMNSIVSSVKLNMDVIQQQFQQENRANQQIAQDNNNAIIERGKILRKAQNDNFNRFESQMAAQQKAYHESNTDFIEMLRGTRDVYDNDTGKMHSVDYYHVDGIVNGMNQAANDPNRFVQIPLRYEQ